VKSFILLAILIAGLFALSAPNGYACSCAIPEVPQAFSKARAVFVGEVTEILRPRTDDPKAPPEARLYSVKFRVERAWKGAVVSQEITLLSDQGRAGCFSWGSFRKGGRYLVYAEGPQGGNLAVWYLCNRTALLASATEDLKKLDAMGKPTFSFPQRRVQKSLLERITGKWDICCK